jgi:hypothetical protein
MKLVCSTRTMWFTYTQSGTTCEHNRHPSSPFSQAKQQVTATCTNCASVQLPREVDNEFEPNLVFVKQSLTKVNSYLPQGHNQSLIVHALPSCIGNFTTFTTEFNSRQMSQSPSHSSVVTASECQTCPSQYGMQQANESSTHSEPVIDPPVHPAENTYTSVTHYGCSGTRSCASGRHADVLRVSHNLLTANFTVLSKRCEYARGFGVSVAMTDFQCDCNMVQHKCSCGQLPRLDPMEKDGQLYYKVINDTNSCADDMYFYVRVLGVEYSSLQMCWFTHVQCILRCRSVRLRIIATSLAAGGSNISSVGKHILLHLTRGLTLSSSGRTWHRRFIKLCVTLTEGACPTRLNMVTLEAKR